MCVCQYQHGNTPPHVHEKGHLEHHRAGKTSRELPAMANVAMAVLEQVFLRQASELCGVGQVEQAQKQ